MSSSNLQFIKDLYAAFSRGDGPAALSLMDPNIVWNEAENFPYADHNPYIGSAAVAEGIFFRLATEWDNFQVMPAEFHDAGETVVVTGRYNGVFKATRTPIDSQFAHFWRLRDGKVTEFQQYTDTAQAARVTQPR
jgi:ketosteroid isomerase-like protein